MSESIMIDNALVYYAKFKTPALCYQKAEVEGKPFKNKEYVADFLFKPNDLENLKDKWENSVKALTTTKKYTAEEFIKRFKVEAAPPDEYKNARGKFETVKFKKHASYADGTPTIPPSVRGYFVKRCEDKEGNSVTAETLLGNGSLCKVQLVPRKLNTPSGKDMQLDLHGVQVINLVKYVSKSSDFDDHEEDYEESSAKTEDGFEDHEGNSANEVEDDDFE